MAHPSVGRPTGRQRVKDGGLHVDERVERDKDNN
jgi:hypothetical protein